MELVEVSADTETFCSEDDLNSDVNLDIANIRSVAMEHTSSDQAILCCKEEICLSPPVQQLEIANLATDWCDEREVQPPLMVRCYH